MPVGATLSAARRARGHSVEDLSAVTRIRPHLIRAIEAGDFAACGGDVYARGHVRALAKSLELDPRPLLAELATSGDARPTPVQAPAADPGLVLRERRSGHGWLTVAAVLLGVVACLAALRLVLPAREGATPSPASAPRTATASAAASASAAAGTPSPSASPAPTVGSGALAVSFTVTGDRCWLSVKDSAGTMRLASTLSAGQSASFRDDRKLSIVVGDVSAVTMTVNGQQVPLQGGSGGVKRFVVRASDPLAAFGDSSPGTSKSRSPAA